MKKITFRKPWVFFILVGIIFFVVKPLFSVAQDSANQKDLSVGYFNKMAVVLQHPRCLNCHPKGDYPLVGMDQHAHNMNVKRGPDDRGFVGMKCATCHGEANNANSGVPGAPGWALAPHSMAWVGKSKHEICLALKDISKSHMPLEAMIIHNGQSQLVGWAWHPGANREPAPGTQAEFGELTKKWVESGAACPE